MLDYPFNFPKIRAHYIRRLKRFVVQAETGSKVVNAYLANPGRLWELLLPGTELMLVPSSSAGKLDYTVLACRKAGDAILLHTHLTNRIVKDMVNSGLIEAFKDYRVVREEPSYGRHRFDLLLKHRKDNRDFYLEIKTSTLFAGKIAMFPDAVTKRGKEHLYKLKELSDTGIKSGCIFIVMNPRVEYFLPAYHVDSDFSHAFLKVRDSVQLQAFAAGFDPDFRQAELVRELEIPFQFLINELKDRGFYMLLIRVGEGKTIRAGSLGEIFFNKGYYTYVGSAMKGLSKRISRHIKRKKKKRWHIDYLTAEAEEVKAIPIIGPKGNDMECEIAFILHRMADNAVKGFGSSDCRCKSHLFHFLGNPLHNPGFIDLVQYYRLQALEKRIEKG